MIWFSRLACTEGIKGTDIGKSVPSLVIKLKHFHYQNEQFATDKRLSTGNTPRHCDVRTLSTRPFLCVSTCRRNRRRNKKIKENYNQSSSGMEKSICIRREKCGFHSHNFDCQTEKFFQRQTCRMLPNSVEGLVKTG
jgi:hypothetical protein